jgi:hypothetical protein
MFIQLKTFRSYIKTSATLATSTQKHEAFPTCFRKFMSLFIEPKCKFVIKVHVVQNFNMLFKSFQSITEPCSLHLRPHTALRTLCSLYEQKSISFYWECGWPHRVPYVACVAYVALCVATQIFNKRRHFSVRIAKHSVRTVRGVRSAVWPQLKTWTVSARSRIRIIEFESHSWHRYLCVFILCLCCLVCR